MRSVWPSCCWGSFTTRVNEEVDLVTNFCPDATSAATPSLQAVRNTFAEWLCGGARSACSRCGQREVSPLQSPPNATP